jgi:hypothetical protein
MTRPREPERSTLPKRTELEKTAVPAMTARSKNSNRVTNRPTVTGRRPLFCCLIPASR